MEQFRLGGDVCVSHDSLDSSPGGGVGTLTTFLQSAGQPSTQRRNLRCRTHRKTMSCFFPLHDHVFKNMNHILYDFVRVYVCILFP